MSNDFDTQYSMIHTSTAKKSEDISQPFPVRRSQGKICQFAKNKSYLISASVKAISVSKDLSDSAVTL